MVAWSGCDVTTLWRHLFSSVSLKSYGNHQLEWTSCRNCDLYQGFEAIVIGDRHNCFFDRPIVVVDRGQVVIAIVDRDCVEFGPDRGRGSWLCTSFDTRDPSLQIRLWSAIGGLADRNGCLIAVVSGDRRSRRSKLLPKSDRVRRSRPSK